MNSLKINTFCIMSIRMQINKLIILLCQIMSLIQLKENLSKINIAIVGNSSTGKSSLLKKFQTGKFQHKTLQTTINYEMKSEKIVIHGQSYTYYLYDTQGFDFNPGILKIPQFKTFSAFLIVYDISDFETYTNAKNCIDEIKKECKPENQYMLVLGNKNDLQAYRQVRYKEAQQYFALQDVDFRQVSMINTQQQVLKRIIENKVKLLIALRRADQVLKQKRHYQSQNDAKDRKIIRLKAQLNQEKKLNKKKCC